MKRVVIWFFSLSFSKRIFLYVTTLHLAVIAIFCLNHGEKKIEKPKKRIMVRTMIRQPSEKTETFSGKMSPVSQNIKPVPHKAQSSLQKGAFSKEKKQFAASQIKTKSENKGLTVDQSLLKNVMDSLDALSTAVPSTCQRTSLSIPKPLSLEPLIIEASSSDLRDYEGKIISILQQNLELPEFGDVTLRVQITSTGEVSFCEVLGEESHKNGEFLKKQLQTFIFPCFNEFGVLDDHLIFTITFRNKER